MIEEHNRLAIVIPAYKAKFLSDTLDSIAAQTDQRFCVYIGDDCSPENIGDIVSQYNGRFDYVYNRFDTNLGGTDLVAQWERCIAMTQGEEWIWLFSDDDIMGENCVATFYQELTQDRYQVDLYRFDVWILNRDVYAGQSDFPVLTDSVYLYKNKMSGKCPCFAVEYIFSRKIHHQQGGFQNFDLAWNSDVATWMKFGVNGIVTIKDSFVTWRSSGDNITSVSNKELNARKWKATVSFLVWVKKHFCNCEHNLGIFTDSTFIRIIHGDARNLSLNFCIRNAKEYIGEGARKWILITAIYVYEVIRKIM